MSERCTVFGRPSASTRNKNEREEFFDRDPEQASTLRKNHGVNFQRKHSLSLSSHTHTYANTLTYERVTNIRTYIFTFKSLFSMAMEEKPHPVPPSEPVVQKTHIPEPESMEPPILQYKPLDRPVLKMAGYEVEVMIIIVIFYILSPALPVKVFLTIFMFLTF